MSSSHPQPEDKAAVRCAIGGFTVHLDSDLKQVLQDFAALYPPAPGGPRSQRIIQIDVRRSGRSRLGRRLYRVYADGEEVGGCRAANGVFPLVEWGINLRIIATASEYLQLHAASLSFEGNGFIFAGDSGCGKSTLAAALLTRRWRYLCDEFALLDRDTLLLQPFPKALCIKAGSYQAVRRMGLSFARRRDYVKAFKGRVGYISANDAVAEPAPVRFVVFPTYGHGAPACIRPMSRARAALELRRCCFNRHEFADQAIPLIAATVEGAACFSLTVGDPEETAKLLESLSPQMATAPDEQYVRAPRCADRRKPSDRRPSRREVLRVGAKLAYVAPVIVTLSAHEAFAAGSNPSDVCSTGVHTGGLCQTDTDCCSRRCSLGVCASNQ